MIRLNNALAGMLPFSQAVSTNKFVGHATPHRLFDWHIEVPARRRNQKFGSPEGRPQFPDLLGASRSGKKGLFALCQAAIGTA
jgi:hypothetical protein